MNNIYYSDRLVHGFFSAIFGLLDFFHQLDKNNITNYTINNFTEKYHDNAYTNSYNQYFINYVDINLKKEEKYKKFDNYVDIINFQINKEYHSCELCFNLELREYINYLIKKYIHLNTNMKLLINNYKINNNYFGVHIRHTDHFGHGVCKNIDEYLNYIDNEIYKYDGLYVMCDEYKNLDIIKKRYKNVYYVEDIIRSYSSENIHGNSDKKFKIGQDIILETYLLSQCSKLLISNSNISSYAICLNTKVPFHYIDMNISYNC